MNLDAALRAAEEAGYLHDPGSEAGAGPRTLTPNDLLDAISREHGGTKIYRPGDEPPAPRMTRAEQRAETERYVVDELTGAGIEAADLDPRRLDALVAQVHAGDVNVLDAYERAVKLPTWRQMPRATQQQIIEEQVRSTRSVAAEMVKMKYPSIPAAAVVAQRKKLTEGRP